MTWQQTIDEEKDIAFEECVRQGLEREIEQGMEQGMERGIAQGLEQGQYNTRIENAKTMLSDGMELNLIAKYTGLSVEVIESELCR